MMAIPSISTSQRFRLCAQSLFISFKEKKKVKDKESTRWANTVFKTCAEHTHTERISSVEASEFLFGK